MISPHSLVLCTLYLDSWPGLGSVQTHSTIKSSKVVQQASCTAGAGSCGRYCSQQLWSIHCENGYSFNFLLQVLAAMLTLFMLVQTLGQLRLRELSIQGHIRIMFRAVALAYAFNYTANFWCVNGKGLEVHKLLCHISKLETEFRSMGAKMWSRRQVKFCSNSRVMC